MRWLFFCATLSFAFGFSYEYKQISESPRIYLIADFLTEEECDYLISNAEPLLERSKVVDAKRDGAVDDRRTSFGMFFPNSSLSSTLKNIHSKIFEMTQIPLEKGENLQVLRYEEGGEYQPHYDYFSKEKPGGTDSLKRGGQRVATFIMYLNTPEKGGETIFPLAKLKVFPKKGNALLFYNVDLEGKEDTLTLHGGAPVEKGEKWIATKWFREKAFR